MACRTARPKKELLRVVRAPDGEVRVDPTGRANGRGAYVCPTRACIDEAMRKHALARALETPVAAEWRVMLLQAAGAADDEGGTVGEE